MYGSVFRVSVTTNGKMVEFLYDSGKDTALDIAGCMPVQGERLHYLKGVLDNPPQGTKVETVTYDNNQSNQLRAYISDLEDAMKRCEHLKMQIARFPSGSSDNSQNSESLSK